VRCLPVLLEPVDDGRHLLLEAARDEDVQQPHTGVGAVLEIVRDASRNADEGAFADVDPRLPDQDARRAFQDVEDLVVMLTWWCGPGQALRGSGIRYGYSRFAASS
jgi:hypothetical protein